MVEYMILWYYTIGLAEVRLLRRRRGRLHHDAGAPRPDAGRELNGTSTFRFNAISQIAIRRILNDLPCIDRHTATLAGKAMSLLQNTIGEFSRLPLDLILCHGTHDKARNLAARASQNRRSSEFVAGSPKILDGHTGPFWVSFV